MPLWKKTIFLLTMFVVLIGSVGCSKTQSDMEQILDRGTLRVLMNPEFPPYEYKDSQGNIIGVDVEIAKRIAEMLGVELEIIPCDYADFEEALLKGEGDLIISAFTATQNNKEMIDISQIYLSNAQYIVAMADNDLIVTEDDLEGKILGVQQYAQGDIYVTDMVSAKNIERYAWLSEAAQVLMEGKLDAIVVDKVTADALMQTEDAELKKIYIGGSAGDYCIGMKKGSDLKKQIDALLVTMRETGEIEQNVLQNKIYSSLSEKTEE